MAKTVKELTSKLREKYLKMLAAYSKGKIAKGRKHERKLIQIQLEIKKLGGK